MTSLNPVIKCGHQVVEAIQLHEKVSFQEARARTVSLFRQVGIPDPAQRFDAFPHQLSGGLKQRVMIAMALSMRPELLIADEPTTALDVTIQAQILDLMRRLQAQFGSAILMITHNLGVINEVADRVAVMYMGKVVEVADRRTLFKRPAHPYTIGLLQSVPSMGRNVKRSLSPIPGMVPDPFSVPKGCAFHPRCPANKSAACQEEIPLVEVEPGHWVRCTLYTQ
jgi:oligopeptide/dipeptide ABC transporter ATP-binding protein